MYCTTAAVVPSPKTPEKSALAEVHYITRDGQNAVQAAKKVFVINKARLYFSHQIFAACVSVSFRNFIYGQMLSIKTNIR